MPFLPTFNDFKNVSISINPLNLFSDSTKAQSSEIGEANDGIGKAGPGPSSLANMGGRPGRPSLKSETSSSESFDVSHVRGRSAGQGVMIQEDQRPKREKKKKVQMDVSDQSVIILLCMCYDSANSCSHILLSNLHQRPPKTLSTSKSN